MTVTLYTKEIHILRTMYEHLIKGFKKKKTRNFFLLIDTYTVTFAHDYCIVSMENTFFKTQEPIVIDLCDSIDIIKNLAGCVQIDLCMDTLKIKTYKKGHVLKLEDKLFEVSNTEHTYNTTKKMINGFNSAFNALTGVQHFTPQILSFIGTLEPASKYCKFSALKDNRCIVRTKTYDLYFLQANTKEGM